MRPIHWHRFPFLFLVIPLISGNIASRYLAHLPSIAILCSIIVSFTLLLSIQRLRSGASFVIFTFIGLFSTGVYLTETRLPPIIPGNTYILEGRCDRILSPGKIIVSGHQIYTYLQIPDSMKVSIGDSLSCSARLYPLVISQNQHDFNYNNYLHNQGINVRGFPISAIQKTGHSHNLYSISHSAQVYLLSKLQRVVPDSTTYRLLAALCLGNRQDVPPSMKQLFQETGTIHLLAISGLHMGAIFILLSYLLKLFRLKNKKFRLILIPLIWIATGITGFSPSACRAAAILSFITIGQAFRQETISLNAIAAAAFFSLLVKPELLYSVSFQMSYAAYTGIILIYPLMKIKKELPELLRKTYSLFCASFSAQILTLPIMAYYFHSISLNSILINIIAVPVATLLLYGGIILLSLPGFISIYLAYIVSGLTHIFIFSLELFSRIVINLPDLYPTSTHIILVYTIIIFTIIYLITRTRQILKLLCTTVGILVIFTCSYTYYRQTGQEIVICNTYKHSTILLNYKGYYTYLKNTDTLPRLSSYISANQLQALPPHDAFSGEQIKYADNQFHSSRYTVAILDQTHPTHPNSDILIVTENTYPPISPHPHLLQLILDNSNSHGCTKAWEEFCFKHQIPIFKTNELGTIVIPLKEGKSL